MTRSDPPIQRRFVELSSGRLHFLEAGVGGAVLLLHGWPGFSFDYRLVLPKAARLGRCIAPDLPGFGESDPPSGDPRESASEAGFAADVLSLMDRLEIEDAVVVGYDIGSAVGPRLARIAPSRISGLVLLNPTHPNIGAKRLAPEAQREAWYQHFHRLPLSTELIDGDRSRVASYLGHFYDHWSGRARISRQDFDTVLDAYSVPGRFASSILWYLARTMTTANVDLPPIQTRAVALWGDSDPMRPLDHMEGFELAFPKSVSRVLPGVGHFVPAEAPDAVVSAIAELL
jgi:pimeloyl-ACP methyl ester carboxylesterase